MHTTSISVCLAALLVVASASSVRAFTYTEVGDAGQGITDATAQTITTSNVTGTGPSLDTIVGTLTNAPAVNSLGSDADIFGFTLQQGVSFTATVSSPTVGADSKLFLFDSTGLGVVYNDDSSTSSLSSILNYNIAQTGTYYLAVSNYDYVPQGTSGGVEIDIFPDGISTGNLAPDPTGSTAVLDNWTNNITSPTPTTFDYSIALTAAQPVPEPAMGGSLFALAAIGYATGLRRKLSRSNAVTRSELS